MEVTTAVKLPSAVGLVPNVTVIAVGEDDVTLPVAPLLNTTVLFALVVLKPNPLITTVLAVIEAAVRLLVTTGVTLAT